MTHDLQRLGLRVWRLILLGHLDARILERAQVGKKIGLVNLGAGIRHVRRLEDEVVVVRRVPVRSLDPLVLGRLDKVEHVVVALALQERRGVLRRTCHRALSGVPARGGHPDLAAFD